MGRFVHQRHRKPLEEGGATGLIVACPPLRSGVNLARIVRVAGCCGVREMIVCGSRSIDTRIARDAVQQITFHRHRTLGPVLDKWRQRGYRLVGLEQATHSIPLPEYAFPEKSLLVIGHERHGITAEILDRLDDVIEIPVFGRPPAYNVATATAIAIYEYCRQRLESGRGRLPRDGGD